MINAVVLKTDQGMDPEGAHQPFSPPPAHARFPCSDRHKPLRGREIPPRRGPAQADIATKEFSGAARETALQKVGPLKQHAVKIENLLVNAVMEGALALPAARMLLYDEASRYSPWLHVPGTVPGEANNGEVSLGERFGADLSAAATADAFARVVRAGFDAYRKGLEKRFLLEGPDLTGFIGNRLCDFERRVAEIVKTAQLHQNNR
jgi:hypothetical protein